MNNLKGMLSIFENLLKQEEISLHVMEEVFEDVVGIKIDSSQISVKGFSVYVNAHPVIKNEILLKKEELIQALQNRTGKNIDLIN